MMREEERRIESVRVGRLIIFLLSVKSHRNQLIAARAFAGMGGGGMAVVGSVIVSDIIPLKQRGLYQGCELDLCASLSFFADLISLVPRVLLLQLPTFSLDLEPESEVLSVVGWLIRWDGKFAFESLPALARSRS